MAEFEDLDQYFPSLRQHSDRIEPTILQALRHESRRLLTLMKEVDAERRGFKRSAEERRRDLELLQTVLLGVLRLGEEERPAPFLEQMLELIARLVGAEVGVLALREEGVSPENAPRLITRHCTDTDLAFIREELFHEDGLLLDAWLDGTVLRLPRDAHAPRVLESLRSRHVRTSIALTFGGQDGYGPRGLLYLEHLARSDAFDGGLELLQECLRFLTSWLNRSEVQTLLRQEQDRTGPIRRSEPFPELIGRSQCLADALRRLQLLRINAIDSPVFVSGDAGTGRTTLARAVHQNSPRAAGPFLALRCDEEPGTLHETLLFGDAEARVRGAAAASLLERARGGTLYLAQVDRLSPAAQVRLSRALLERRYTLQPGDMPMRLETRIVASSHLRLSDVLAPPFDALLADRLTLFVIELRPLVERREDILPLAEHFISEACRQSRRPTLQLSRAALDALLHHPWPGNVAELRKAIFGAVSLCSGLQLRPVHLREFVGVTESGPEDPVHFKTWKEEQDDFQRRLIRQAMHQTGGSPTRAAQLLGITRQYLNQRLRKLGLSELRGSSETSQD